MSVSGSIYGVVLNDRREREALADRFHEKPYGAPPIAPVVYVKPRLCLAERRVRMPAGAVELEAAATLALLFRRDAAKLAPEAALDTVGAAALALDLSRSQDSYYRPAVAQRCGDGLLPLGAFAALTIPSAVETAIDGHAVHSWTLDRLVRPVATLVADLSAFMTLRAGDLLMVGLPGDPPRVRAGQTVRVQAEGLPTLEAVIEEPQP